MSDTTQRFSCPACGQRFAWRPDFAGRTVRCKCGASFEARLYGTELLENRPAPLAVEAEAAAAQRRPAAAKLPVRDRRALSEIASDESESGAFRDVILPLILLALGVGARAMQVIMYANTGKVMMGQAIVLWICEVLLGGFIFAMGLLIAMQIMDFTLEAPGKTVLKLAALWFFSAAAAYYGAKMDQDPLPTRGMLLAWHIVLVLYFVLFVALLRLDLLDALVATVITTAAQAMVLLGIAKTLSLPSVRVLFFG